MLLIHLETGIDPLEVSLSVIQFRLFRLKVDRRHTLRVVKHDAISESVANVVTLMGQDYTSLI